MTDEHTAPDREAIINEFFVALKVTFKNATIYNMEHPAFVKSVEDLQNKINGLLAFRNPLSIGFTPRSLFVEDRFWEGDRIHQELGRLFHYRKIKSLEIRQGITYDELKRFVSKITLSLKDFLREGGAQEILKKENIRHITVEELDYSLLLQGEGEEVGDVWAYLMEEALEEADPEKILAVADSFEDVIGKFNTEDLIVNDELHKNFSSFFKHLKESEDKKYRKCAKSLVKSVVTNRKITYESKFENLKLLISDLSEPELANTLWEEIITDDKFDSISFSIFSKLIEKERHLEISTSLRDLFQNDDPANRKPEVEEKIKALLSGTSGKFISDIYRQTLNTLLQEIDFDKKLSFDHNQLYRNYRFILLNILDKESHKDDLVSSLGLIREEWKPIQDEQDFEFLQRFYEVLIKKTSAYESAEIHTETLNRIRQYVENSWLEGQRRREFEFFLNHFKGSVFDVNTYLDRIFTDHKISPYLLRAFFKFFREYIFYFNINIDQNSGETMFLSELVDSLKTIDTPISLVVLKQIFQACGKPLKIKVLKAMNELTESDDKFLFELLKSKDMTIKAEVVTLLMRSEVTKRQTFERLFEIQSPYGLRNKILLQHIDIASRKKLKEARKHLEKLNQKKGFWNRKLREKTSQILEKWDAEQS
jgi:hypothetical protein